MNFTVKKIADIVKGEFCGDAGAVITGAAPLNEAGPDKLAFLGDPKAAAEALSSKAGCLLAPLSAKERLSSFPASVIYVENPRYCFSIFLKKIEDEARPKAAAGIHPSAVIAADAEISPTASVGPLAVVEAGAFIGDGVQIDGQCYIGRQAFVSEGTHLYPGVKIMDYCRVGAGCIIHAGAVLGADGFGFEFYEGQHRKVPQIGNVVIEDNVEIGANACIDRAALTSTVIGAGSKLDNLVHIAHNVKTGKCCLILAHATIAGSTTLGNGVIISGLACISGHLHIGDGAIIMGTTGVMNNVKPGEILCGHVGRPRAEFFKIEAIMSRLPDMYKAFKKLKKFMDAEGL